MGDGVKVKKLHMFAAIFYCYMPCDVCLEPMVLHFKK